MRQSTEFEYLFERSAAVHLFAYAPRAALVPFKQFFALLHLAVHLPIAAAEADSAARVLDKPAHVAQRIAEEQPYFVRELPLALHSPFQLLQGLALRGVAVAATPQKAAVFGIEQNFVQPAAVKHIVKFFARRAPYGEEAEVPFCKAAAVINYVAVLPVFQPRTGWRV